MARAKRGGENPESVLFSLFLLGMLVARLSFVLVYWSDYSHDPLLMVDLRDGGFLAWPGVIALVLGALAYGWRRPALRTPLGAGVVTGLVFWGLTSLSLSLYDKGAQLPDITLRNASGETLQLADYKGDPLPDIFTPPASIAASSAVLPLEVRVHYGMGPLLALGAAALALLGGAATAATLAGRPRKAVVTVEDELRTMQGRAGTTQPIYDKAGRQVAQLKTTLFGHQLIDLRDGAQVRLGR